MCVRFLALFALVFAGCYSESRDSETKSAPPPVLVAEEDPDREPTVDELLRQLGVSNQGAAQRVGGKIRIVDLMNTKAKDLAPLAGLSLTELYLEETLVKDLSPLAGMPLKKLHINKTSVTDLTPLAGMTLQELNLNGSEVESLAGLEGVKIDTLWLPHTKVADLTPITESELQSLDLEDTLVGSLEPLKEMKTLRRLHIASTAVTDLTPLADLKLDRLLLTPSKITAGMDVIRNMPSIKELGSSIEAKMPAAQFWTLYDAGQFK